MLPELPPSYKFQYFFSSKNPSVDNPLVCLNHNPIFSPPSSYVNPTHVASSSSCVYLAPVASSSCIGSSHVALFGYVNPSVVASSTIVPNPKRKKIVVDDVAKLSMPPDPISKKQNYNHIKKF
jgi:hypothetical protein